MPARFLLALVASLALSPLSHAATSAEMLSPVNVAIAGGDSHVFSARFYDALGNPAAGQVVRFSNDACGRFPNGAYAADVTTDMTGTASVNFTATFPPGIVCHVVATAGVSLRWEVVTYPPTSVTFSVTTSPRHPGQPFTLAVTPKLGIFKLYEVDVAARVVPGTMSASISPGLLNSGQSGSVQFSVSPDNRVGDYEIEIQHHGKTQRVAFAPPTSPWQDMWWGGIDENGWGMSVVQHDDKLFSVIYAYDGAGRPTWYVIPAGTWNSGHTAFTGDVYAPRGSSYASYDTGKFVPGASVGTVTLNYLSLTEATLDYTINGVSGSKRLTRQAFGAADAPVPLQIGDMWWGGAAQNGWGIAMLQQYRTLFSVWFTYDGAGMPTWFVMPAGTWVDANTAVGLIFRTTGSPWLGRPYAASALQVELAGNFRVHFGADTATLDYTIDGKSGSLALTRQSF